MARVLDCAGNREAVCAERLEDGMGVVSEPNQQAPTTEFEGDTSNEEQTRVSSLAVTFMNANSFSAASRERYSQEYV